MAEEFYNAFATPVAPVTPAEALYNENEMGTHQKPPKLMFIEDFQGWKNRFENWVQAYRFEAWCSLLKDYEKPKNERGLDKGFNDFTEADKLKYTSEKMMISILQQAVKEDIFVLLQHNGTARSIWEALIQKFRGSADMIKNKKALLKKSFDMFTAFDHETTKQTIDRYCHLVLEMGRLDIKKEDDEWVDKLAEALPQNKWGTYLMVVKLMRKSESMNLAQFIQKIEEQELDIQKTAIMTNPNAKQDVSLYYRGNKFETTPTINQSPKISTAFSADGSVSPNASTTTQSGGSTSSFSSFDPNHNTSSPQKQNTSNLHCNVTLNIQNGQPLSPEVAKQHMASLVAMLESYESLIAGRIGNPMLTKEDYDQIDAEELELMDVKSCLASACRRAEKFQQITGRDEFRGMAASPLGFDKSKVTCFRCKGKGHFKRECKNQESTGSQEKSNYYQKSIFHQIDQKPQQNEPQTAHGRMIEEANRKAYYGIIDQNDEVVAKGFSWDKYIPSEIKSNMALVTRILDQNEDCQKRIPIFPDLGSDIDTDDEEEYLNKCRKSIDPDSFNFFYADKVEMLNQKKIARLQRELKAAKLLVDEKAKTEAVESKDEATTKNASEKIVEVEKVVEKIVEIEKLVEVEKIVEKIVEVEKFVEIEKIVEVEKLVEVEKTVEVEKMVEKVIEVAKPCEKCLEGCKVCEEKDKKFAELERLKEDLLSDVKYVKESYDVLNRTVDSLKRANAEFEKSNDKMSATLMTKQSVINDYIEDCANLKKELELEKIESLEAFKKKDKEADTGKKPSVKYNRCPPPIFESYSPRKPNEEQVDKALNIKLKSEITDELPDNIDVTFTASDTDHESELVKRVVDQVLDTDEESKPESKSDSSSSSEKSPSSPVKRVYNKEFLLSQSNLNDESIKVAYTLNDSDKLYSDEEFPIRSVKTEMIKQVFKLTEINISEIKDLNLVAKPKKYTSRVQQRLNKKKGYDYGSGYQKKPNHNGNLKKKGLGFNSSENHKNQKTYKPKTNFVSGGSSEDEQKKPFWKQSNQEFLAEVKKNVRKFASRIDRRTCFKCQEVGHIAWNCPKTNYQKQGVSSTSDLRKTCVDKKEQSVKIVKKFENSTSEEGESSNRFYKRRGDLSKQKWVVKSESNSDNESDSIKSEESLVEKKIDNSVPVMNDENFPKLSKENLMKKVGKVEISNQFFADKEEFDVEKAFNRKVKNMFGKMVDKKVKGATDFYKSKCWWDRCVPKSPKAGEAWVDIMFE
ncbi:putative transcription factor interactor and regulator CCHC(Zn) family [Helianthus debilis subsp. tardiflorus]